MPSRPARHSRVQAPSAAHDTTLRRESRPQTARQPRTAGSASPVSGTHTSTVPPAQEFAELRELMKQTGCVLQPLKTFEREFADSVTNRLKMREAAFVYLVGGLPLDQLPARCCETAVPPAAPYEQLGEGADVEPDHGRHVDLNIHGRLPLERACSCGWHVSSAAEAVGAGNPCACNADATLGDLVSGDGEMAGKPLCKYDVLPLQRGQRAAFAQGRHAPGAGADDGTSRQHSLADLGGRQVDGRAGLPVVCCVVKATGAQGQSCRVALRTCTAQALLSRPASDERYTSQVPTAVHSRGSEGVRQGQGVVLCEVGGLTSIVGSLED
eukprot:14412-Pleurochrysis_carterae.AAC.2